MRISDWSSDVCSSDLVRRPPRVRRRPRRVVPARFPPARHARRARGRQRPGVRRAGAARVRRRHRAGRPEAPHPGGDASRRDGRGRRPGDRGGDRVLQGTLRPGGGVGTDPRPCHSRSQVSRTSRKGRLMSNRSATLAVLRGDGIGPEITEATLRVLDAAAAASGLPLDYRESSIGFDALARSGTTFPDAALAVVKEADGTLLGPVSHNEYPPLAEGGLNPSGELRKRLDLYANIRPAKTVPGLPPRCGTDVDLVIVRENTEGRSEEHTSELQSLMRISYAVFCL